VSVLPAIRAAFLCAGIAGIASGCVKRTPESAPEQGAPETPATAVARAMEPLKERREIAPPPVIEELVAPADPDRILQLDPPVIPDLERDFRSATDPLAKAELATLIADAGTPEALQTLERLYFTEPDLEMRIRMIDALRLSEPEEAERMLPMLRDAIRPGQPDDLREAAMLILPGLDHPAVDGIWRGMLSDANPEIREFAEKMLEFRAETREQ
jgi:HEAT repeat protein